MEINDYIEKNYNKLSVLSKQITKNHQNAGDLLNECIFQLLNKGNDYCHQLLIDDKVLNYLAKMMKTQYNSSTSPFYFTYRNPYKTQSMEDKEYNLVDEVDNEDVDIDKMADDINVYIGKLNIYERTIASRHFIEGESQRNLSKQYNINRIHISKTVKTVKSNIKMNFSKNDYKKDTM